MSIFFFDGFDYGANRQLTSIILGLPDYGKHWSAGGFGGAHQFSPSVIGSGESLKVNGNISEAAQIYYLSDDSSQTNPVTYATSASQARAGAWFKADNVGTPGTPSILRPTCIMSIGTDVEHRYIGVQATWVSGNNHILELVEYNSASCGRANRVATRATSYSLADATQPTYIELWVDSATQQADLKVNGSTVLHYYTTDGGWVGFSNHPFTGGIRVLLNSFDNTNTYWDHFWLGDGSAISIFGNKLLAVQVAALEANSTAGLANVSKGFIEVSGTKYYGTITSGGGTQVSAVPADDRYFNDVKWTWSVNPSNSATWDSTGIAPITSWGVCYQDNGSSPTLYLMSLELETLYSNAGMPKVSWVAPSAITGTSGTWNKTDPALSYAAHVSYMPSEDSNLIPGYHYLYTNVNSCLQFYPQQPAVTFTGVGLSFAEEKDPNYQDWASVLGEDFVSYFVTGYKVHAKGDKRFQSNYVSVHYKPVTNGGATFQPQWDYSNDASSLRWGTKQEIMKSANTLYDHAIARLKVRGQGRALQFRVTSESGKPFFIDGWVAEVSGNAGI